MHPLPAVAAAALACAAHAQPVAPVYQGQPALIGNPGATWSSPSVNATSPLGYAVIRSRATGGGLASGVDDVALLRAGPRPTDPLIVVAVTGQNALAPGLPAGAKWQFSASGGAAVNDDGVTAMLTGLTGPGITATNNIAAVRFDPGGSVVLLRTGSPAPGLSGQTVSSIQNIRAGRPGGVGEFIALGSLSGGGQALWRFGPGGSQVAYSTGQQLPTQTGGTIAGGHVEIFSTDETGAIAIFIDAGGAYSIALDDGRGGGPRLVLQPGVTTLPSLGPNARIGSWSGAVLAGGQIVCPAQFIGAPATQGVIRANAQNPAVEVVVAAPTPVPELGPAAQISATTGTSNIVSFDPDGGILFAATVTGSTFGNNLSTLWYVPPAWTGEAATPRLLVRQGQTFVVSGSNRTVSSTTGFFNGVARDGRVLARATLSTSTQCLVGGLASTAIAPVLTQDTRPVTLPGGATPTLGTTFSPDNALNDRGRAWVSNDGSTDMAISFTVPGACGLADVGKTGGLRGPDAQLDNNDFVVYIDLFFSAQGRADVGRTGGATGRDGALDNNDFIAFIEEFFAGCA